MTDSMSVIGYTLLQTHHNNISAVYVFYTKAQFKMNFISIFMKTTIILVLIVATLSQFNYQQQQRWGGVCQTGREQSPIDMNENRIVGCIPNFQFQLTSSNRSYTQSPQATGDLTNSFNQSKITITRNGRKKVFSALQFHFHEKSEHTINGRLQDLQVHIVHQDPVDKQLAVFGILFRVWKGNFSDPFDRWNLETNISIDQPFPIPLATPRHVFHYKGSLTTPTCSEGVEWFVDRRVIPIKESSRDKISKLLSKSYKLGNNRKIQPLNSRSVYQAGHICRLVRLPSFINPFYRMG